jgi:hypothetical protein
MRTKISGREFEVMLELHHICPTLLVGVWNQLEEYMLGCSESSNKKIALTLLAHMFSEENSNFAVTYRRLWNNFKNWYVLDYLIMHGIKWADDEGV